MLQDTIEEIKRYEEAEEHLLKQVDSFRRRYNSLYPSGPLLLLTTRNENEKVVPVLSLVVPSPQPHPELLSLDEAAQTLANLLTYTPPPPGSPLPRKVRSAAVVAKTQRGEAAECALVVASVLLGAGYRAFVAQGMARPSLVAGDTSTLPCPYLAPPSKAGEEGGRALPSKYSVKQPPDLRSRYILIMEERARRRLLAEQQQQQQKRDSDPSLAESQHEQQDVGGSDFHFWVLVLPPKRQLTSPTFLEPSTGKVTTLPVEEPLPYLHVHALFNHSNYWASTQPRQPISADIFDLDDRSMWLPLIDDEPNKPEPKEPPRKTPEPTSHTNEPEDARQPPQEPQNSPSKLQDSPGQSQDPQESSNKWQETPVKPQDSSSLSPETHDTFSPSQEASTQHQKPPSASQTKTRRPRNKEEPLLPRACYKPVVITEEALLQRFPGGWREEVYQGTVVRRYAPLTHPRGATLALTLFTPEEHHYWREPSSLSSRVDKDGVDNPWRASELEMRAQTQPLEVFLFHSEFRVDALRRREVRSGEWREEYADRSDLLLRRTVTFASATSKTVQKIEEEFASAYDEDDGGGGGGCGAGDSGGRGGSGGGRGGGDRGRQAVERRVMMVAEGRVHLLYHYGRHRLLQPSRTFIKPADGVPTSLTMDLTQSFQPDPGAEEPTLPQLWEELEEQMEAEARTLVEVRQAVEETEAVKEARVEEEERATLLPGIFDTTSNATVQQILKERAWEEAHREETERKKREEREGRVDTIAPYLPLLQGGEGLEEAVKERCLQDLRDRLALRANLLQDKLDQARETVLTCREEVTRRKRVTAEERAALNAQTAAAEAAHRRLRAHLAAWRHEAEERYETMAAKLEADPRICDIPTSTATSQPADMRQGSPTSPAPRR